MKEVLDEINTSIPDSAYKTMRRINRAKASNIFGKYIDSVYQLFPLEMKTLEKMSNEFTKECN